ncbi:hypothetical protein KC348_g72 [Hortaea werneckii]|nr:hypothetical protein KC348_g72 [Hortaea werneckii]
MIDSPTAYSAHVSMRNRRSHGVSSSLIDTTSIKLAKCRYGPGTLHLELLSLAVTTLPAFAAIYTRQALAMRGTTTWKRSRHGIPKDLGLAKTS